LGSSGVGADVRMITVSGSGVSMRTIGRV